ncbi:hypothetical protein AVEN_271792-1 [Araneus ventricosus]|uniref:Uncharacterized protein n=1 Tax=Araneus ventricosus TaxID=182803 RepID=A0A4Y2IG75_ARAVE|nr:hypothetical protein AVEN_271792-1 [Araneus ventricosus]
MRACGKLAASSSHGDFEAFVNLPQACTLVMTNLWQACCKLKLLSGSGLVKTKYKSFTRFSVAFFFLILRVALQFQLHKVRWVAVSSTVGLRVERRHHLRSVCLQDVVLVDKTDENRLGLSPVCQCYSIHLTAQT